MPDTDIFPLPMAAFERYMLADDRPDYPMTFFMALRLSGQIDHPAMDEALSEALQHHPLLRAVVYRSKSRHPCWIAAENTTEFDWNNDSVPLSPDANEQIDLAARPGLRAWARQGAAQVELTFQFHHSCCDAIGAMKFIGDVLRCYANRTTAAEDRPGPSPTDIGRLHDRALLGRVGESTLSRLAALLRTFPMTLKFITRRPRPLSPVPNTSGKPAMRQPAHGIKSVELSEETTRLLHDDCRRQGITINDRLLRDMFLTAADWNRRTKASPSRGWLKVLMPTNLRTSGDVAMPAANLVSMCFITRRAIECEQPDRLMREIHRETSEIKRIRRGLYFIRVIEAALALRGKMPGVLVGRRCRATAVLSNMGRLEQWFAKEFPRSSGRIVAGNLTIESIIAAPPIRPNTTAALMAFSYADRLNINVLCDHRFFSAQQIEHFLRDFTARLYAPTDGDGDGAGLET